MRLKARKVLENGIKCDAKVKTPGKHNFSFVHDKAGEVTFSKVKVGESVFHRNFSLR
jgi:hypothetical protein